MPGLSIGDASISEGNSGTSVITFTVTATYATAGSMSVGYSTATGTAVSPDDFTAASGSATIAAGQTSTTISVAVIGDTAVEVDETFRVMLSNAVGATIADGDATGTIVNDDVAPPASADVTLAMTASPTRVAPGGTVTYTITLGNRGPDSAYNLILSDTIPMTLRSCNAGTVTCEISNNTVTVRIPTLAKKATATITLVGEVSSTAANNVKVYNTAGVSPGSSDPRMSNNTATVAVTIRR
ncbi:MAG TPA: Calx-beta domain-containing protein [Vicinamibacterales bacterium]|nr:Calx-beta domain-containing protein [Vicinamibacterales bacterium]